MFLHLIPTRLSFLILLLTLSFNFHAQWSDLNTGINDNLTGVVFWGNNGIVSGEKGIYYTTTGGSGPSSWTRFNISGNTADSILYNNTQFNHCFIHNASTSNNLAYACGEDTVNNTAVIMKFNLPAMTYTVIYVGASNTRLVGMGYTSSYSLYYAVGDDGLIIAFNSTTATNIANSLTQDLTSIHFNSNKFCIGTQDYRIYGTSSNPSLTFSVLPSPGNVSKDVHYQNSAYFNGVGNAFHRSNISILTTLTDYDFGPLNGQSLTLKGTNYFIGTDHGIFKQINANYRFEWQPSSLNYNITDFWFESSSTTNFYACGKNGTLLKSTNDGGATKPYATMSALGTCVTNGTVNTFANPGSGTFCSWTVNGSWISGTCASFSYPTNVVGSFPLTYISNNGTYSDTAYGTLNIVNPPSFNLPYTVADTILCQAEPLEISIQNSQLGVYYSLYKYGSSTNYGNSVQGNGGTLIFQTNPISIAGDYYLRATNSLASCYRNFTDTIHIVVEKTTADLHVGLINAELNELTPFYERTVDAQNFAWTFVNQGDTITSSLANPLISFFNPGTSGVKLISWSNAGCFDSIQKAGPKVIATPTMEDSCWVNMNESDTPYYYDDFVTFETIENGYITIGNYIDEVLNSRNGDSLSISGLGTFISKYDHDGTLKWAIKNPSENGNGAAILAVTEDTLHNLYISGINNNKVIDNGGDTLTTPSNSKNFITKLDSNGREIWTMTNSGYIPRALKVDNENNLIVSGSNPWSAVNTIYFRLNNLPSDTLVFQTSDYTNNRGIIKIDPNGTIIWHFGIKNGINTAANHKIGIDSLNNIYVIGVYEADLILYSTNDLTGNVLAGNQLNYGDLIFLAKYNTLGVLQWRIRSESINAVNSSTDVNDLLVDSEGSIYISGKNECDPFSNVFQVIESTDGTTTSMNSGRYFAAKINTNGVCQWLQGATYSYYGVGRYIEKIGNEIFILAQVAENDPSYFTSPKFTSNDGGTILYSAFASKYAIVVYDTSGNLLRLLPSNNNSSSSVNSPWNIVGFKKGHDDFFYVCRYGTTNSTVGHSEFGVPIITNNDGDGWVTKFHENCAIPLYPNYTNTTNYTVCSGSDLTLPNGTSLFAINADTLIIDSLTTINSADSLFLYSISIIDTIFTPIYDSVCYGSSYTFPNGNTQNNIVSALQYSSIFQGSNSCDSVVITNLHIVFPDTSTVTDYICLNSNYTFPDGSSATNISAPLTQTSLISSTLGCDSVVITNLDIFEVDTSYITTEICMDSSYTFPDGSVLNNIVSPITQWSTISTFQGCDSVIRTIVSPHQFNTSVQYVGGVLESNESQATYQWLDCNNGNTPLLGENSIQFTPNLNGSYSVQLSSNGCIATSDCYTINDLSVATIQNSDMIQVYPNPTNGELTVLFNRQNKIITLKLIDVYGKEIVNHHYLNTQKIELTLDVVPAVYFLELRDENDNFHSIKIVKSK